MPSRRGFLRRAGGAAGLGLLASAAGCTGLRFASSAASGSLALADHGLDESAFDSYVVERRGTWGDHGVFGARHAVDAAFERAWARAADTGPDEGGYATAEFAVARYRLGESGAGDRIDAWVLWGATRPTSETTDDTGIPGGPALSLAVRGLGVHLSLGGPAELVHYDPASDVRGDQVDEYTVASGVQTGRRVSVSVPLDTGLVNGTAPDSWTGAPETGFDADGYTVGWRGRSADAVSVGAVCTTELPPDADPAAAEPRLGYHVAAGGYL